MIRDTHSNALVENNITELQKYRRDKKQDREIMQLRKELAVAFDCINRLTETIKRFEKYDENWNNTD